MKKLTALVFVIKKYQREMFNKIASVCFYKLMEIP
jgi:hypothetical protein